MSNPILGVRVMGLSNVVGIIEETVQGVTAIMDIRVPNAGGMFWYKAWLSDSATDPAETQTPPSSGNQVRWEGATDVNGRATIAFANNQASHTWYLWVLLFKVNVSDAIQVGV